MRVDTKSLKEQYSSLLGSQEIILKPLATQKLKGQAGTSQGILSNSNADLPIPKSSIKSEEKKNFYRKAIFSLSESDRSRLGSLITCPPSPPPTINSHYLVNLPKSSLEIGELPSKDVLKDRITYHCMMSNLDSVSDDGLVDFVSLALETYLLDTGAHVFASKLPFPKSKKRERSGNESRKKVKISDCNNTNDYDWDKILNEYKSF